MILTLTILVLAAASRKMKILRPLNTRIVRGITFVKQKLLDSAQSVMPLVSEQATHSLKPLARSGDHIVILDDEDPDHLTIVALVVEQEASFPKNEFVDRDTSHKCEMSDLNEIS